MQQIIVTIDAGGEVKVEARGVVGTGCAALTKSIEEAVGRTAADVKKAEFYGRSEQCQKQVQK